MRNNPYDQACVACRLSVGGPLGRAGALRRAVL